MVYERGGGGGGAAVDRKGGRVLSAVGGVAVERGRGLAVWLTGLGVGGGCPAESATVPHLCILGFPFPSAFVPSLPPPKPGNPRERAHFPAAAAAQRPSGGCVRTAERWGRSPPVATAAAVAAWHPLGRGLGKPHSPNLTPAPAAPSSGGGSRVRHTTACLVMGGRPARGSPPPAPPLPRHRRRTPAWETAGRLVERDPPTVPRGGGGGARARGDSGGPLPGARDGWDSGSPQTRLSMSFPLLLPLPFCTSKRKAAPLSLAFQGKSHTRTQPPDAGRP